MNLNTEVGADGAAGARVIANEHDRLDAARGENGNLSLGLIPYPASNPRAWFISEVRWQTNRSLTLFNVWDPAARPILLARTALSVA